MVVSNPPYIAVDDSEVDESVREWEPASALFAGGDGLDDIRAIMTGVREWLKPGGWLVLEIGYRQGDAVLALASECGLVNAEVRNDLAHRPRILICGSG